MTLAANDGWGAAVTRSSLNFKVALIVTSEVSTAHKQNSHSPSPMVNPTSLILQVICSSLLMVFSNHPSGNFAYNAFSHQIRFTEAPEIGSEFVGYYIGKMRQLDDISFEFDSLRSSFNLRYLGIYYLLTLTEGVSSNVIRPENNIIVSLNGVVQEPSVSYEIVGF